jgi:tripartite-type tricarboxylate transporter receptor subunit TctC
VHAVGCKSAAPARAACRIEITSELEGGNFSIVKFGTFGGDPSTVTWAAFYVVWLQETCFNRRGVEFDSDYLGTPLLSLIQEEKIMGWTIRRWLFPFCLIVLVNVPVFAALAQDNFFRGKTIRLIVGLAPGGGFDTYSRVIARHMGKHIPGNPAMIVDNMPGAASLLAANYIYKAAKPDGLTIGNFVGGLVFQQILGLAGVEFDGPKFEYLGVPAQDNFMIGIARSTGITSIEQWKASGTVLKIGGVAPGGGTDDIPKILKATLGLPLQMVSGYKGTGPVRLAFNSGEVQGICNSWESFKATWRAELDKGEVTLLVQANLKPHPEVPNVPWAPDLAKSEEARRMILTAARTNGVLNRFYVLPPGTQRDRVRVLRKAFLDTIKDPEFVADTQRAKLDLDPIDGEEIQKQVRELFKLEPALVAKMKEILK